MADPSKEEIAEGVYVEGSCARAFEPVRQSFIENFTSRGELGAAVCITLGGENVVDLWGGRMAIKGKLWREDTLCPVYSSTKGATALCVHLLADRGEIAMEQPVSEIWPEFACNGKQTTRVAMMLDHSAGVPVVREKIPEGNVYDWDYMADRIAAEEAFWQPGTRHGYHGLNFGWTAGEMVRRISGQSLGKYFQSEVAKPLGLDFWIGLPESEDHRVATRLSYRHPAGEPLGPFLNAVLNQKGSIASLFVRNSATVLGDGLNTRAGRAAEIPSANGITNARGLAGLYRPLANNGTVNGKKFIGANTIGTMGQISMASHCDATLMIPTRFAQGFMKRMDNRALGLEGALIGDSAFGHVGAGGSIGFADPEKSMSLGYVMNKAGPGLLLNPRGQSLVDAAYECLDRQ